MLKIYGANLSSPANKVRFVANALDMEYEYIQVSLMQREQKQADFLKLNPAGKIPVIDDGGFILFESNAIIKYLTEKYNSSLYPRDKQQRALIDQWIDFTTIHIGGAMGRVLFNRVFAPFAKVPVDEQSLADGERFLKAFLPVGEAQLAKADYFIGECLTLADIVLLATLDSAEVGQVDLSLYPNIVQWRGNMMQKDFYTKCHNTYAEALESVMVQRANT